MHDQGGNFPLQRGFQNALTGLGTSRDKATHWRYARRLFNDLILEDFADAYCTDDLVHKIASRTPKEMLSRGYEIKQGEQRREDLEQGLEQIGFNGVLLDALIWERLFGGSAILMGADDGREKIEPLDMSAIRAVRFSTDLERRDINGNVSRDSVLRLHFYRGSMSVHRSRLILFRGAPCPRRESAYRQGWGIGKIEFAWDEITAFNATWRAFRHLLEDGNQAVFKIQGLIDQISRPGGEDAIQKRMEIVGALRSVLNALILDTSESFERQELKLAGYADALEKTLERLAMAVDEPIAILVGRQPTGLNATDKSSLTIWYDAVAAERKHSAEPAILKVAEMIAIATKTESKGLSVEWPAFWRPDEAETAGVEKIRAETATILIASAALARGAEMISMQEEKDIVRVALGVE